MTKDLIESAWSDFCSETPVPLRGPWEAFQYAWNARQPQCASTLRTAEASVTNVPSSACAHCGLTSDIPKCGIKCARAEREIALLRDQRDTNLAKEVERIERLQTQIEILQRANRFLSEQIPSAPEPLPAQCKYCDQGSAVTADGFHKVYKRCSEYPNENDVSAKKSLPSQERE